MLRLMIGVCILDWLLADERGKPVPVDLCSILVEGPMVASKQDGREIRHADFLCGWGAGCIETCTLFPSSKIIFRQQLHGFSARVAWSQLKSEGLRRLYRGLLPPLIMRTSSRALMFGLYDEFQSYLACPHSPPNTSFSLCHAQAAFLGKLEFNTGEAFHALRIYGYREYYRGLSVILARNSLSNALFFTLKEPFKKTVIDTRPSQSHIATHLIADFVSGAILGACISTVFFPMNVVKNHMQSKVGVAFENPISVFCELWRERQGSLRGLYLGVHLNFTRSLLAWGITNTVYELLRRTLKPCEEDS
ncbi:hypothetical protein Q1695_001648 [Nippostrongylus brasiliensis]|nr:hypothetical protein Q1695_001648 [Nippostrongylus brasiliensis]